MKQKFKVGDKVKCISSEKHPLLAINWAKKEKLTIGKIYTVFDIAKIHNRVYAIQTRNGGWFVEVNNFELYNEPKTLTIKKLTRTRAGKEYHTFQFSVKGKIVNHQFDTEQGRDKSLNNLIKYFQNGDFKIVKG